MSWARVDRSVTGLLASQHDEEEPDGAAQLREIRELRGEIDRVLGHLTREAIRARAETPRSYRRGRPPCEETVDRAALALAPEPELYLAKARHARAIVGRISDTERLLRAYAFSTSHDRRARVITALADRLTRLGINPADFEQVVSEPPWDGFSDLRLSPSARQQLRESLAARTVDELERALTYERETQRRVGMLGAIERELRRRT